MRIFGSAGVAAAALLAGVAEAAPIVVIDTVNADDDFIALCGGSDNFGCEYAVAQGVAGNRQDDGNVEAQIFDRLTNTEISADTQAATPASFLDPSPFTLSHDADGGAGGLGRLTFDGMDIAAPVVDDYDFSTPVAGDNPDGPARSLVIRVSRAALTDLTLDGQPLPDLDMLSPLNVGYIYLGFDATQDWLLSGTIDLSPAFQNSGTGFQVKVTDLEVAVPLPPSLALLAGALAGLGLLRRRSG